MGPGAFESSKRDFLKRAASFATLAYGWSAFRPAAALAETRHSLPPPESGLDEIRDCFPLSRERVYFNNGTLGPSPSFVLDATVAAMREVERTGEGGEAEIERLRTRLAEFVGADAAELALTRNTTEGINLVAQGLDLAPRDEVVVTDHEHVGGALPWLNRARLDGIVLRAFSPPPTADGVLRAIESLLGPRTRVIAVPHVSCTTGQVFPIAAIARMAAARGVLVAVDGAHGTGMLPLALRESGVDFYASCLHKWLCGPKGVGYLYVRADRLDRLEPRFVGAYSDSGWSVTPPRIDGFVPGARRFDYGTRNLALYAGGVAALDFFARVGATKIYTHGSGLASRLREALARMPDAVEILTPEETSSRAMMLAFRFRDSARTGRRFAGFASGSGFRVRQVPEAGLDAIRVSTHLYNSTAEVDRFVGVVEAFLADRA